MTLDARSTTSPQSAEDARAVVEGADELAGQERLVAALREVEEPFRTTAFRHYFRGESIAEIASAEGVAEAVVRLRLARAKEGLEARLAAPKRTKLSGWIGPLLMRWFGDRGAGGGLAAKPVLAGIGAVLLGLAIVTATRIDWASSRQPVLAGVADAERGGPNTDPPRVDDPELPTAPRVLPGASDPELVPSSSAQESTFLVATLVGEDGLSVSDAIAGLLDPITGKLGPGALLAGARSDGVIELEVSSAVRRTAHPVDLDVRFSAPGRVRRDIPVVVSTGERVNLGEIVLARSGALHGRVLDADGAPVVGVELRVTATDLDVPEQAAWPWIAPSLREPIASELTDADGEYRITGVRPGVHRVWALARGRSSRASRAVDVLVSEVTLVEDLVLPVEVAAHRGLVLDSKGNPVHRARVDRLRDGVWVLSGFTDEHGSFTTHGHGTGSDDLHVWSPRGEAGALLCSGVAPDGVERRFVLPDVRRVRVHVRAESGAPVLGASWRQAYDERMHIAADEAAMDSDHFDLIVPAVKFVVDVSATGHGTTRWTCEDPTRAEVDVTVTLPPAPVLRGRVVDARGEPIEKAEVVLWRAVSKPSRARTARFPLRFDEESGTEFMRTGPTGEFTLTVRDPDARWVTVEVANRIVHCAGPFDAVPGEPLLLQVAPSGSIEGRLLFPEGRRATGEGVGVSFGDGRIVRQRVDRDGRFRFEGLGPGRWWIHRLVADATGRAARPPLEPEARELEVTSGRTTHLDLDLRNVRTAGIRGRVALEGITTWGWTATFVPQTLERYSRSIAHALTREGAFRIADLEPEPGTLVVRDTGDGDVRRELCFETNLPAGELEFTCVAPTALVLLDGWSTEHGLALVSRPQRGIVATTRIRVGVTEALHPAGRIELHRLAVDGEVLEEVLSVLEAAPGERVAFAGRSQTR